MDLQPSRSRRPGLPGYRNLIACCLRTVGFIYTHALSVQEQKGHTTMKKLIFSLTSIILIAIALMAIAQPVLADGKLQPNQGITVTSRIHSETGTKIFLPAINNGAIIPGESEEKPTDGDALSTFISTVSNGVASQVVGAYVENTLSMPVVQQPANNAGWISSASNTITQFGAASSFGTTGLLAHNTHAGIKFFDLSIGDEVVVVMGNGETKKYQVESIRRFQALQPTDPYSDFIDLENNAELSATDLFYQVYTGEHHVTFQTCIAQDGQASWGRLFVIATPLD